MEKEAVEVREKQCELHIQKSIRNLRLDNAHLIFQDTRYPLVTKLRNMPLATYDVHRNV